MEELAVNEESIFFLDFIFNPNLRTLQKNDTTIQLRKKQSDILALLCAKYPDPVSQDEFLSEVWDGGYVTSQSIAQMIRSLRVSLGDKYKSIIVTIPKLGYRLAVEPTNGVSLAEMEFPNEKINFKDGMKGRGHTGMNVIFFPLPSVTKFKSSGSTALAEFPYTPTDSGELKRKFIPCVWVFSTIAVLFLSLILIAGYTFDDENSFFHCVVEPASYWHKRNTLELSPDGAL